MKRFLMPGLLVMALTGLASAQPTTYFNNTSLISPPDARPQIAADSFFNNSIFDVTIPVEQWTSQFNSYSLNHTLNLTNRGVMTLNPGFVFRNIPKNYVPVPGVPYNDAAANFVNQGNGFGGGVINCTGKSTNAFLNFLFAGFLPPAFIVGNAELIVNATNIENSGSLNMNASSLLKLTGQNINLNRGELRQASPTDIFVISNGVALNQFISSPTFDLGSFFYYTGIVDGYWGTGFDLINPAIMNTFPAATSQGLIFGAVTATTRGMKDRKSVV